LASRAYGAPDDNGNFSISNIGPGEYHFEARLPGNDWYVKSITSPSAQAAASRKGAARSGAQSAASPVSIKPGDKIDGLTITFAEGAASLTGHLVRVEGTRYNLSTRLHLVPAEPEFANEPLRYAESLIGARGSFSFSGIPPGRYWLFGVMFDDSTSPEGERYPSAWNPVLRQPLRKSAETAGQIVELKPCQQITDFLLEQPK